MSNNQVSTFDKHREKKPARELLFAEKNLQRKTCKLNTNLTMLRFFSLLLVCKTHQNHILRPFIHFFNALRGVKLFGAVTAFYYFSKCIL